MSGHLGDLSSKQETALEEFRKAVGDILQADQDDRYLLRWLRARDFNVNKAERMLREHLQWRQEFGADTLLHGPEAPEVLRKYYPGGMTGHDRDGCPVWLIPFGNCDLKGMLMSTTKEEMMAYVIRSFEFIEEDLKAQSIKLGKAVETQTYIFDFGDFSVRSIASRAVLDFLTGLMSAFESNYPERLKKAFVINAPRIFPVFWRLVRPFLSEATAQKLHLFGCDGWKDALLAEIDADQLPKHWGGTLTDPDGNPRCPSIVIDGGRVPPEYYRSFSKMEAASASLTGLEEDSPGTLRKSAVVDRQGFLDVPVRVDKAGTLLTWELHSEDVRFGIFYQDDVVHKELPCSIGDGGEVTEVIKPFRIKGRGKVAEEGAVTCTRPGLYVLKFDNTFSWLTSKTVSYSVRLTAPT